MPVSVNIDVTFVSQENTRVDIIIYVGQSERIEASELAVGSVSPEWTHACLAELPQAHGSG